VLAYAGAHGGEQIISGLAVKRDHLHAVIKAQARQRVGNVARRAVARPDGGYGASPLSDSFAV